MPSEPIKRDYDVSVVVESADGVGIDRTDLSIAFAVRDGGEPFWSGVLEWFDLPAVAVDWMRARIGKLTGNRLVYRADGLTYREVVKFQTTLIKMLVDLNARGVKLASVRPSERPAMLAKMFRIRKSTRPRRGRR